MNIKAQKFSNYLANNQLQIFQEQELQNEMHSVVYQSFMEVSGQHLPIMVVIDDSIYVMVQVRVAAKAVNNFNKASVMDFINKMNCQFKVFKYYVDEEDSIILESCIPTSDNEFTPGIVDAVIDVILKHLNQYNSETMKTIGFD